MTFGGIIHIIHRLICSGHSLSRHDAHLEGTVIRLTRRAFSFLRKKYKSVLLRCHILNIFCALALLASAPAGATSLTISAPGGSATIGSGGVYESIRITGSANPTIDITNLLTIIGPGNNQSIITGATSAHLRVINTVLSLGSATETRGGLLRGDIYANAKLNFTGVPGEANIDTQTMDYRRCGGNAGFIAKKENFSLGVNYQLQADSHTTGQAVFDTLAYEF